LPGAGQLGADAGHVRGGVQEPEDEESVVPLLLDEQELAALRPRSAAPSGRPRILPVPQPVRVHRRQLVFDLVFEHAMCTRVSTEKNRQFSRQNVRLHPLPRVLQTDKQQLQPPPNYY